MPECEICGKQFDGGRAASSHERQAHNHPWQDEEMLREHYIGEGMRTSEIADKFGCSSKTIRKWLHKFGIELRDRHSERSRAFRVKPASYCVRGDGYCRWGDGSDGRNEKLYVHRLLAIAKYGVDEVVGKDVHHKNGIPWDNRPENIEVVDKGEHGRIHANQRWDND